MFDMNNQFIATALKADFFAGGLALGLFGLAAAAGRVWLIALWGMVLRRIWVSLTLDNRSPAYRHFIIWMDHNGVLARSRHMRLTDASWAVGTKGYAPAPGRHWFVWQGHICSLGREISDRARIGAAQNQRPMETLTVTVLFGRIALIVGWIDAGRRLALTKDRIGPGLHVLKGEYWEAVGDIPRRALDTILVDDDRVRTLVADMRWFYSAQDWYAQRGVPWRRGYLFYGPPGTGKSSLIRALASELSLDIATLDVGRATLTDDDLREAIMRAPKRSLIVIEDVDAIFTQRDSGDRRSGVSFSGLLNAIDGVAAQEGRALIMTTNHKDRLDRALIRPGRADIHMELGLVNAATARRLFARFFPADHGLALQFEDRLRGQMTNPAVIQGWLLVHSADPQMAATATGIITPSIAAAAE